MTDVVAITVDKQPNPKVVKLLEDFLDLARAGDIVEVGIVGVFPDGIPRRAFARGPRRRHDNDLTAGVGDLLHELNEDRAARYIHLSGSHPAPGED